MYWKRGFALLGALCIGMLALVTWGAQVATAVPAPPTSSDYVNIYTTDQPGSTPRQMIQDGDTFWFTDPGRNAIGKLVITDTTDFVFTFYPITTTNSQPYDLVKVGDIIWFTQLAANKIGKLDTTTGAMTDYTVPTANSEPTGIDVYNDDGTVWFVQRAGNTLAKFDPTANPPSSGFKEFVYDDIPPEETCEDPEDPPECEPDPIVLEDVEMEDMVVVDGNDFAWFTAPGVNKIVGFDIANETFTSVPTITSLKILYTPSQIVKDNKNNLWVSTREGQIGIYSPSTVQVFRWFTVGSPMGHIDGLFWRASGVNSEFWFTESNTGFAGYMLYNSFDEQLDLMRFTPGGTGGGIYGIAAETDGTVWIASSDTGAIIEWTPPYFDDLYLPFISK